MGNKEELRLLLNVIRREQKGIGAILFVVSSPEERRETLDWLGMELERKEIPVIEVHVDKEGDIQNVKRSVQTARGGTVIFVTLASSVIPAFAKQVGGALWMAKSNVVVVFWLENDDALTSLATLAPEFYSTQALTVILGNQQKQG